MGESYSFEHSIECPVSKEFAWSYWAEVSNWAFDSDIESIVLHGPFVEGTHGTTISRSSGRIEWVLSDVRGGESAVIEIAVPGGKARFKWTFEDRNGATRITEQLSIGGEHAQALGEMLQSGIPAGMRKLGENLRKAAKLEK